jgi:Uma2 family endonuclease
MATSPSLQPTTIREYLKFKSPEGFRDELVYGKIIVSPEPKPLHFDIADNIYRLLISAMAKKYKVAQRVNLRFPAATSMPSPDVFVTSRNIWNAARAAGEYPDGKATLLAVEVLSPGNRKKAIKLKVDLYQQNNIEAWVVDPKLQQITVHSDQELPTLKLPTDKTIALPKSLGTKSISLTKIFDLSS